MNVRRLVLPLMLLLCSFAAVAQELPELNPSEYFDGKAGGTFGAKTVTAFPKTNRVAVTGFRVVYVTHNEARAMVRGSYLPGRDTGTARAKMEVDLKGVDDATLQAITDRAYQNFLEQLKAAGREVVTADPATYSAFNAVTPVPQEVEQGLLKGRAFAPTGMPLFWQAGDSWGNPGLGMKNMKAFNAQSNAMSAPLTIAPLIVVDFAHMQSSGNRSGLVARRAEVGASLVMSVPVFSTRVVRAEQVKFGGVSKGDDAALWLTKPIDTELEFADLYRVDTKSGKVLSLVGADNTSKRTKNVAETTNEEYAKAATAVLAEATGAFAKLMSIHAAK